MGRSTSHTLVATGLIREQALEEYRAHDEPS